MISNDWLKIKKWLNSILLYPDEILENIAAYPVLELCMMGYSNESIAKKLDFGKNYVSDVIKEYLNFSGFREDLVFQPIVIYFASKTFETFYHNISNILIMDVNVVEDLYQKCKSVSKIKERIDNWYAKQR